MRERNVKDMKLLSIIVPSYNSEGYLARCLDTLVRGGSEVEVIVVNDGSTDGTARVAQGYCEKYPDIVRLENKPNGGHGSAINRGLELATGEYFKVVDSDDWFDDIAYRRVMSVLRSNLKPDLLIANYVYEFYYNGTRRVISYRNVFPRGRLFSWDEAAHFRLSQMLLMHSMIYRTQILRDCGLKLPEHTFYVDNIVAYQPLPFVNSMFYLDCNLYRYFIGRPDQSVNTPTMIKRIDQQLLVTRTMVQQYKLYDDINDPNLRRYMFHYLSMMVSISLVHLNMSEKPEDMPKGGELWRFIHDYDRRMYETIHSNFVNLCIRAAGKCIDGRGLTRRGFNVCRKIYKFS